MKSKLILLAITIAWVFVVIGALSSCNVNKHITKTSTDSSSVVKKDSSSNSISELSKNEGSSTSDSNSLQVDFYNIVGEDSVTWTPIWIRNKKYTSHPHFINPKNNGDAVYIQSDNHGGYKVTSNAPIKSIKIKDSKTTEQHKTIDSATTNVNVVNSSDSSHLVKQVTTKEVVKKSGWSLLDWVVVISISLVCIFIAAAIYLKGNPLAYLFGFVRKKEA